MEHTHNQHNPDHQLNPEALEKVWKYEILAVRKWRIESVFGKDASERYHAMPQEKDFFVNTGRLPHPDHPKWFEDQDEARRFGQHNRDFWNWCKKQYPVKWRAYEQRVEQNIAKYETMPGAKGERTRLLELESFMEALKLKWANLPAHEGQQGRTPTATNSQAQAQKQGTGNTTQEDPRTTKKESR